MKKWVSVLLVMVLMVMNVGVAYGAQKPTDTVQPNHNNATNARATVQLSSSGTVTINLIGSLKSSATSVSIVTYIEQKIDNEWVRIDNGQPQYQWVDTVTSRSFNITHSWRLPERGEYRVDVTFRVYGSLPTDTISQMEYVTY